MAGMVDTIRVRNKDGKEIEEFCERYRKFENKRPLVAVPTSYNHLTESDLQALGFQVVIYANHLIRSAYPSMLETAETILQNGRSMEVDQRCMSIKEILNLIPGGN